MALADPVIVTVRDTSGVEISDATVTYAGTTLPSGGTHDIPVGSSERVQTAWRNATFYSGYFTLTDDGTLVTIHGDPPNPIGAIDSSPVTPGGGLRVEVILDRGPLSVHAVDPTGATLPVVDAFGHSAAAPSVGLVSAGGFPNGSPSGTGADVAYGFQVRVHGAWRNASIYRYLTPLRATRYTVQAGLSGDPIVTTPAADTRVDIAFDKVTATFSAEDSLGVPAPQVSLGPSGAYGPSPVDLELAAGTPSHYYWVRLTVSPGGEFPTIYPYLAIVRDLDVSVDGTVAHGWPPITGQRFRFVYPAADACPDDPDKIGPGACGCGVPEDTSDADGDGALDCVDGCPADPNKADPGVCGCGVPDGVDECTSGAAGCAPDATCTDTACGFTCTCPAGTVGTGFVCVPEDSCTTEPAICGAAGAGGRIAWGVLELGGGVLAGFRCEVSAPGAAPVCDVVAGTTTLRLYDPMCAP